MTLSSTINATTTTTLMNATMGGHADPDGAAVYVIVVIMFYACFMVLFIGIITCSKQYSDDEEVERYVNHHLRQEKSMVQLEIAYQMTLNRLIESASASTFMMSNDRVRRSERNYRVAANGAAAAGGPGGAGETRVAAGPGIARWIGGGSGGGGGGKGGVREGKEERRDGRSWLKRPSFLANRKTLGKVDEEEETFCGRVGGGGGGGVNDPTKEEERRRFIASDNEERENEGDFDSVDDADDDDDEVDDENISPRVLLATANGNSAGAFVIVSLEDGGTMQQQLQQQRNKSRRSSMTSTDGDGDAASATASTQETRPRTRSFDFYRSVPELCPRPRAMSAATARPLACPLAVEATITRSSSSLSPSNVVVCTRRGKSADASPASSTHVLC